MQLCMEMLAIDGYGYTRGYRSDRIVILSTGRIRVRITVLCYGYGSGSKTAVPADPCCMSLLILSPLSLFALSLLCLFFVCPLTIRMASPD